MPGLRPGSAGLYQIKTDGTPPDPSLDVTSGGPAPTPSLKLSIQ
jgi:hypothetical protein